MPCSHGVAAVRWTHRRPPDLKVTRQTLAGRAHEHRGRCPRATSRDDAPRMSVSPMRGVPRRDDGVLGRPAGRAARGWTVVLGPQDVGPARRPWGAGAHPGSIRILRIFGGRASRDPASRPRRLLCMSAKVSRQYDVGLVSSTLCLAARSSAVAAACIGADRAAGRRCGLGRPRWDVRRHVTRSLLFK
jgi:hypothetical protein